MVVGRALVQLSVWNARPLCLARSIRVHQVSTPTVAAFALADECHPYDHAELLEAINKVIGEEIHIAVGVEVEEEKGKSEKTEEIDSEPDPDIDDFLAQLQAVADKHDVE